MEIQRVRHESRGTSVQIMVIYLRKADSISCYPPARKRRDQRNGRRIPQPQKEQHIQKTLRHDPRDLRGRVPRRGYRVADVCSRMERKAKREEEGSYGISGRQVPVITEYIQRKNLRKLDVGSQHSVRTAVCTAEKRTRNKIVQFRIRLPRLMSEMPLNANLGPSVIGEILTA